jgi:hypothetical protein
MLSAFNQTRIIDETLIPKGGTSLEKVLNVFTGMNQAGVYSTEFYDLSKEVIKELKQKGFKIDKIPIFGKDVFRVSINISIR